jgi:hypothetical protein
VIGKSQPLGWYLAESKPKAAIARSLAIAAFGFIFVSNPNTLKSIRSHSYLFSFTITDYSAVKF